jgi:hypothetical protein
MPRIVATIRDKINARSGWTLAWLSLVCGVIGGAAASACSMGGLVKASPARCRSTSA